MKKVIRLTESDLKRIVERIIKESEEKSSSKDLYIKDLVLLGLPKLKTKINSFCEEVKDIKRQGVENIELSTLEKMDKEWKLLRQALNHYNDEDSETDREMQRCRSTIKSLIRKKETPNPNI